MFFLLHIAWRSIKGGGIHIAIVAGKSDMEPHHLFEVASALAIDSKSLWRLMGDCGMEVTQKRNRNIYSRRDVALLAVVRQAVVLGLNIKAAASIVEGFLPAEVATAADVPDKFVALAVEPSRYVWGICDSAAFDGAGMEALRQSPWPFAIFHPRTAVAMAFSRLDGESQSERYAARMPYFRRIVPIAEAQL
jgi:hypothetical protein